MAEEPSREGWAPVVGPEVSLEEVVERAFDYRGDVTVVRADGTEVVGYVFNRDRRAGRAFLELLTSAAGDRVVIPYADVRTIRFTGKDAAAGQSYEAWVARKAAERGSPGA